MNNAQHRAGNVVTVEGGIMEGYLFIDSRQDENTVPQYDACPSACALFGMDNLVDRHVRSLVGMDNVYVPGGVFRSSCGR